MSAFVQVLEAEGAALSQRAAPAELGALTDRKNRLADQLQQLGQERDAALQALGYEPGHAGANAAAAAMPAIAPAWAALQTTANTARQLNERSGIFIRTHLQFANDALAALRSAATSTTPYGADGRPAGGFASGRSRQA